MTLQKMLALGALVCAGFAHGSIAYDASLTNGVYYGTGNGGTHFGWTVDSESNIEIGLRAKLTTFTNPWIDTPTNVYDVPTGFKTGTVNHSAWNYDFSIDLLASGDTFTAGPNQITATFRIKDLTNGDLIIFNPLAIPDNASNGNGKQNSENPLFGGFGPNGGAGTLRGDYSVFGLDTYQFTLTLSNAGGQIASDTILVNVTPEPSSIVLMLGGGLALFAARRRIYTR